MGIDSNESEPANLRALVVDDNLVNRRVAELLLKRLGIHVDQASDGHGALAALCNGNYQVVLMDIQMPVMDGLEVTRQIRLRYPKPNNPRIIAVTADGERQTCIDAGMDDHILKPLTLEALRRALLAIEL